MTLARYTKKRNFTTTPEPPATVSRALGLRFVVQKHAARRLHYDFRLELDGVLKSWAVPKGPSMNPKEKHLAMMVEDHPLEYRTFEGVIPEGNYGAGPVMVWDEGSYTAEQDMREGLRKGKLVVELHGKKLNGAFALVKMKNSAEDNAWLLIKERDGFVSDDDIRLKDRSVRTNRTMDDISAGREALPDEEIEKILKRAPQKPMPTGVRPMLAKLAAEPFSRDGWAFEIKWDGYRAIAYLRKGTVDLRSRNQISFTKKYSSIAQELRTLPFDAVLDGEIVALDADGISRFQLLQQAEKSDQQRLQYVVFDLLYFNGHDLRPLPLRDRKALLRHILPELSQVTFSQHVEREGKGFYESAERHGLEGIIAKDMESTYRIGIRSMHWLKIKTHRRQEAVIGGYTEGREGRKEFGALLLGTYDNGNLVYIGHTGGGFNDRSLKSVKARLREREIPNSPFSTTFKTNAPAHWVRPELVAEVKFSEWTDDGHMRQPIFLGLREDKNVSDVTKEEPEEVPPGRRVYSKEAPRKEKDAKTLVIDDRTIKITHWNNIFFPDDKITKGGLIDYYRTMSRYVLPHLKDRPESLNRFPHGLAEESFYQKDSPDFPSWIPTVRVHSDTEDRDLQYVLCNDEATLVYLVQLGCIDMNPWNSHVPTLEVPDYLVMDLDPEDIAFAEVVKVARTCKKIFDELEAPSFCKTSGATGLHIFVPLEPRYAYDQVKVFAEIVARKVHAEHPLTTSVERSPSKRQKKVYLDYLQNRRGQTMASAYSVRPRPGATVSTPLAWPEVKQGLDPKKFTMKTIGRRVKKLGDLWAGVFEKRYRLEKGLIHV